MADQGSARSIFVGRWVRVLPVCRARSRRMDVRPPETLQMAFGRANRIPLSTKYRRGTCPGARSLTRSRQDRHTDIGHAHGPPEFVFRLGLEVGAL